MSEHSLIIALKYSEKLKEFDDIAQAEKYFISYKDELLNRLEAISGQLDGFSPDYTIESLKDIEKLYFPLYRNNTFGKLLLSQKQFESIMSVYWGEVVIKNNADAKWLIEEFAFSQGKYELLVNKGLCNISIFDMFQDLYKRQDNKRQNLLFREYNRYFARQL